VTKRYFKRPPTHPMYCIVRIDSDSTHCWWVRFFRGGRYVAQKTFSDGRLGGRAAALKAAKHWRDRILKRLLPLQKDFRTVNRRNWSGVVGVSITCTHRGKNTLYSWSARYQSGLGRRRKQVNRVFSILRFGYEEAFRKALRERARHTTRAISDVKTPKPPRDVARWMKKRGLRSDGSRVWA
jgi:hypothetical protein